MEQMDIRRAEEPKLKTRYFYVRVNGKQYICEKYEQAERNYRYVNYFELNSRITAKEVKVLYRRAKPGDSFVGPKPSYVDSMNILL